MNGVAIRRSGSGLVHRLRRGVWGAVAVILGVAPGVALGQGAAEYLAVAAPDTPLVSGDAPGSYPIVRLSPGQILLSDGGTGEWKRVTYPAGTACYLRAEEATIDAAGKVATLTKPSRLRAINMVNGRKGSWRVALDQPLPEGTKLTVLGVEEDADPRARAYRVEAPEGARAYVRSAQVRAATAEEIAAHLALHPSKSSVPSGGAAPASPQSPAAQPGTDLTQPQSPTGVAPAPPPSTPAPEAASPRVETPQPTAPAVPSRERAYLDLLAAFDAARRGGQMEAELDTLIGGFERALAGMDVAERDSRLGRSMQQRLDVLRLGAEIRDQKRALAAARDRTEADARQLESRLAEIERQKRYTLVGRLGASAVYDGARLPRLYRVQAVGTAVPLTLGYLKPDDDLGLDAKMGSIVGIVGDGAIDPATGARVITPQRIDVLTPEQIGVGNP